MQIPILNGIYTDDVADFRTSYPVNMIPVPKQEGISNGYLRPADGAVVLGSGPGVSRGGINWNNECYRVMGTKLVKIAIDGTTTILGDVSGSGQVTMTYSFDRLAIASDGALFYWDGVALTKVVDPDLGAAIDVIWIDGYFMTTDGESLVVTELSDPTQVNPLKYGSSEVDPDAIVGLLKVRNEAYALNRYTIEVYDNVGGEFFPFERIDGAQIQKGAVGTNAFCLVDDAVAFVGNGRNESPSVYIGQNANAVKISTREIDDLLSDISDNDLSNIVVEYKNGKAHKHIWIRLPDRTIVYDLEASRVVNEPVWFQLTTTTIDGFEEYRVKDIVWCYGKWLVGDSQSSNHGYLDDSLSTHFGEKVKWEFGTTIAYNEGKGIIVHELELVALTGRAVFGDEPTIGASYSTDGVVWSQERFINAGLSGDRNKRLVWMQQGGVRNWRIQRFRGDSDTFFSPARLEARVEPLMY